MVPTVIVMVVLGLVMLSLVTLTSKVKLQSSIITEQQTLSLININTIESLNHQLNSTGKLEIGSWTVRDTYQYKPYSSQVTVMGSVDSDIYLAKVVSRYNGIQKRPVETTVLLALEVNYDE